MLFLVTVISYVDRQSFAVAAPVLLKELELSQTQYGAITSAFLICYAVGQALGGRLIDTLGTKRALAAAVFFWSIAAVLHAFGRGFYSFMALRAVLGLFESANFPAAIKGISEWFPNAERSMATGIFLAGASFGAMIAPPLLGAAIHHWGWQEAFVVSGLVGFVWLFVWRRFYALPETHPAIAPDERAYILEHRPPLRRDGKKAPVGALLRQRPVIGLMLARFVGDNIFLFYTFWLPLYLSKERGLNLLEIGYFAWIPFLFTDLGSLAAGWVATRLMRAGLSLDATRKLMLLVAAVLVPCSMFSLLVENTFAAVLLIGCAMFFNQFKTITVVGLPGDLFSPRDVATVWGFLGAAGSFGGFLFSPIIGWSVDNFSFTPVFVAVSISPAIVMAIILIFIPRIDEARAKIAAEEQARDGG